jgi:hypothetical protein
VDEAEGRDAVKQLTRYDAPRGTTMAEADGGQFVLATEADALFAEKDAHIADLAARFVQRERDISDDTRTIAMLEARIAELEPSDKWLGEVMAMLHGDGGHYVAKHGAEKAALDAVAKYHALLAERDKLAKACDAIKRLHMHSTENRISEAERLKEESRRLFADNIRLEAELDAARADAERYRWLRDNAAGQWEHPIVVSQKRQGDRMLYVGPLGFKELDAAIDAARGKG